MKTREQLIAEKARINERGKRRKAAADADTKRWWEIEHELHRCDVLDAVGIEGGVRMRYRRRPGDKEFKLNDVFGTLKEVRRTRCTVDFGEHGRWTFPIDGIVPAAKEQGWTIG